MTVRLGWLLAGMTLVGCRHLPSDARWVRSDQLGDPAKAKSVGLMEGQSRSERNYLPQGQDTDTVQDELTLTKFDASEACVALVVRTPSSIDRAVTEWELWLNGRRFTGLQRMNVNEGPVSKHDYPVVRQVNIAQGWGPGGSFGINVPQEGVFTVVERHASVCVPRADVPGDELWIEVDLGGNTPGSGMSHTFGWKVVASSVP